MSTGTPQLQVFRLSDQVAVVGLPGEIFVGHGLAIQLVRELASARI